MTPFLAFINGALIAFFPGVIAGLIVASKCRKEFFQTECVKRRFQ
jgi:hypothetical protein